MTSRQTFLVVFAGLSALVALWLALPLPHRPSPELDPALWAGFSTRFVSSEGMVIDADGEAGPVTHTEGLGYGMLLAEAAGDRDGFARIWTWTNSHLRRTDGLFSWKFADCGPQGKCVADHNNASDGDILIAWALLRAGQHWGSSDYVNAAHAIAAAVAAKQIVSVGRYDLLLPGTEGFQNDGGTVVNPSYWIFPAFQAFAVAFKEPLWQSLSDSGLRLLREARYGRWGLPPDWLRVDDKTVAIAEAFPPRYGFNAVRVPLYLVWGKVATPDLLQPYFAFWNASSTVPAWVDLDSGETAPYPWSSGMRAISVLTKPDQAGGFPLPDDRDGYYSWSLALLSRVAAAEAAEDQVTASRKP